MASRLIPLAATALAMLYVGIATLDLQVNRTEAYVNFSAQPQRVNESFNLSKDVAAETTTVLGVGLPGLFTIAIVVLVAVLLFMAGGGR